MLVELDGLEIHALAVDKEDRALRRHLARRQGLPRLAGGKPEVFYDPKAKYIWAMAFDSQGNLFVATGDAGEIHRVTPAGKGAVFFKSDETHARSHGGGRQGQPDRGHRAGRPGRARFPRRRGLRAVPDGQARGHLGGRRPRTAPCTPPGWATSSPRIPSLPPVGAPVPTPSPVSAHASGGSAAVQVRTPSTPPPTLAPTGPGAATGGSEVYRIEPDGDPRKMWTHPQDIVYAIAFDAAGRALLGTGNKGYIYRVDSPTLYTALLNGSSTQVTDFASARDGRLFAVTGNVGKIYEIGPAGEKEGAIESDVFDAAIFSHWGRLSFDGRINGGGISIAARSGNLDQPQKNWSPWSAPITVATGARPGCPPARFVQWKATLTADAAGHSPELESVEVAYLPKNIEPRLEEIEITPSNYKFPPPSTLTAAATPQPLPAAARKALARRRAASPLSLDIGALHAVRQGLAGRALERHRRQRRYAGLHRPDPRRQGDRSGSSLKDKVREKYVSFDSTAFPDGEYRLRVIASDAPSNAPSDALTAQGDSEPFLIDNTPPVISELTAARNGAQLQVRWKATDALTYVKKAEYSLDGGDWTVVPPAGGLSDSLNLAFELALDNVPPGEHTIAVRVEDEYDNQSSAKTVVKQ